jgi:diacylglycerol kinase (ATP)
MKFDIGTCLLVKTFFRSRLSSFRHAFVGLFYVIRTQKNAWIHTLATFFTILLALWLQLSNQDWAILILTISTVWTAEFINTALEAVVDLASPQKHPLAKVGKDVGAAAVLISAFASLVIGLLILGPPLWNRLAYIFFSP